jgi:hypothetical protein
MLGAFAGRTGTLPTNLSVRQRLNLQELDRGRCRVLAYVSVSGRKLVFCAMVPVQQLGKGPRS